MCLFFNSDFYSSFLEFLWEFVFCVKTSVLTIPSQDKVKKGQRKSAFVAILWRIDDHYL